MFVVTCDIEGGNAVDHAFDTIAFGIIDKGGNRRATLFDSRDAVLVVKRHRVGHTADGARGLVAVGVIAIAVAMRGGHGVRLTATIGRAGPIVVGQVADGVIGIGMVIDTRADVAIGGTISGATNKRPCQAVQLIILKTLTLGTVLIVNQLGDVATIIIEITQRLQVIEYSSVSQRSSTAKLLGKLQVFR